MSISLLSPDVQTHLRSGVAISTPSQCVEELVLNSLDADATCIAVRIDLHAFKMQVVDNGCGISPQAMKLIGERYATSKCHSIEDLGHLTHYGYRGEALASLRQMSCVMEIESLAISSVETYSKLFSFGRLLSMRKSSNPRPGPGTTITLHNFMYNLPVRRQRINETFTFEDIHQRLQSIALIHPEVSFSLRNDVTNQKCLQTKKESSMLATFSQLFGQAQADALHPVEHTVDIFTVKGFISTNGFYNSSLQFIYVNKRLMLKTRLHKVVNACFTKSLIARNKGRRTSPLAGQTSSPPKPGEKWGIFVLDLSCPYSEYDVCLDPNKSLVEFRHWDAVLKCFQEAVDNFLVNENLKSCTVDSPLQSMCSLEQNESIGRCTQNYDYSGNSIHLCDVKHTLQSLPAKRACTQQLDGKIVKPQDCVATKLKSSDSLCGDTAVAIENAELIGNLEDTERNKKVTLRSSLDLVPASYAKFKLISKEKFSEDSCDDELSGNSTHNSNVPYSSLQTFKETFFRTKSDVWNSNASSKSKSPDGVLEAADQVLVKKSLEKYNSAAIIPHNKSTNVKSVHIASKSLSSLQKFKFTLTKDNPTKYNTRLSNENNCFEAESSTPKMCPIVSVQEDSQSKLLPNALSEDLFSETSLINKNVSMPGNVLGVRTQDGVGCNIPTLTPTTCTGGCNSTKLLLTESKTVMTDTFSKPVKEREFPTSLSLFDVPKFISEKSDRAYCDEVIAGDNVHESGELAQTVKKCNGLQKSINSNNLEDGISQFSKEGLTNAKVRTVQEEAKDITCELNNSSMLFTKVCPELMHSAEGTWSSSHINKNTGELECPAVEAVHNLRDGDILAGDENKNISTSRESPMVVLETDYHKSHTTSCSTPLPFSQSNEMVTRFDDMKNQACTNPLVKNGGNSFSGSPRVSSRWAELNTPEDIQRCCNCDSTTSLESQPKQHKAKNIDESEPSCELFTESEHLDLLITCENEVLHNTSNETIIKSRLNNNLTCGEHELPGNDYCSNFKSKVGEGINDHIRSYSVLNECDDVDPHTTCSSQEEEEIFALVYREPPKKKPCMIRDSDKNFRIFNQLENMTNEKTNIHSITEEIVANLQTDDDMHHSPHKTTGITNDQIDILNYENFEVIGTQPFNPGYDIDSDESLLNNESFCKVATSSDLFFSQTDRSQTKIAFSASDQLLVSGLCYKEPLLQTERKNQMDSSYPDLTINQELHKSCTASMSELLANKQKGDLCTGRPLLPVHTDNSPLQIYHTDYKEDTLSKRVGQNYHPCNKDKLIINTSVEKFCNTSESAEVKALTTERKDSPQPNSIVNDSFTCMEQFLTPFLSWKGKNMSNLKSEMSTADQGAVEFLNDTPKDSELISSRREKLCSESDSEVEEENNSESKTVNSPLLKKSLQCTKPNTIAESPDVRSQSTPEENGEVHHNLKTTACLKKTYVDGQTSQQNANKCREGVEICNVVKGNNINKHSDISHVTSVESEKAVVLDASRELTCVNEVSKDGNHDSIWRCQVDAVSGRTVYVHQESGLSSFDPPATDKRFIIRADIGYESAALLGSTSIPFHPHSDTGRANASKSLTTNAVQWDDELCEPETNVKWRNVKEAELAVGSVIPLLQEWENPMWKQIQEEVSGISVKDAVRPAGRVYPLHRLCQLNRDFLSSCKVLNQLDNKFIVCLSSAESNNCRNPNLVVLFDQHAVHERIRLEHLQADVQRESGSGVFLVKSHSIEPPMEVSLDLSEVRIVGSFLPILQRWGFKVSLHPTDRMCIHVCSVPSFLLEREINEVKRKRPSVAKLLVQDIIRDAVKMLQATGGASHMMPQSLHNILCSQACHGAVKFGDPLDVQECRELVRLLCKCRLPFQCAHGRPTVVPLLNLELLNQKDSVLGNNRPKLWKLRQFKEKK